MCQTQHYGKDRIPEEITATVGNLVLWRAAIESVCTDPATPAPVAAYLRTAKRHYTQAIDRANVVVESLTAQQRAAHAAKLARAIAI